MSSLISPPPSFLTIPSHKTHFFCSIHHFIPLQLPPRNFKFQHKWKTLECKVTTNLDAPPSTSTALAKEPHKYFDQVVITVRGGDGGHGAILNQKPKKEVEKGKGKKAINDNIYKKSALKRDFDGSLILPMGGHGGDVVIYADESKDTLLEFHNKNRFNAKRGGNVDAVGVFTSYLRNGTSAPTVRIPVPLGTVVKSKRGKMLADLARPGDEVLVARGGQGGISLLEMPRNNRKKTTSLTTNVMRDDSDKMWEDLIQKAKDGGLDVIDTYVFWNVHEPSPSNYNFEGRYDLVHFIKTVQKVGLYVHLRIGPYVCAEWNFGGFPVWLKYVPGISFRTDNGPFKAAMEGFTQKIVQMMKNEKLFQSQGGPIILSQIENEYGPQGRALGASGRAYSNWAAKMAVGLGTGVPWVMCLEDDAPDPVINACNGFYCDDFIPNKPYKPKLWTESWSGWFSEFGGPVPQRPVQDLAFAVARFIQKGGSLFNYYMYHGGTNFGRSAGGPFITTSYDYDAPIDEYGLLREPKYGHLKDLHKAIKQCEHALVSSDPKVTSLGAYEQAYVFSTRTTCAAFLANYHSNSAAKVTFNNRHYDLPAWSISILPDCRTDVFNTARVRFQPSQIQMLPSNSKLLSWETYDEDVSSLAENSKITASGLLEQLNATRDTSDYLWYITSIDISPSESFLRGRNKPSISVHSSGDAVHVFINGKFSGSAFGTKKKPSFNFNGPIDLRAGTNKIALLSVAVGLPNGGIHFESRKTGITGPVFLHGLDHGQKDLTGQKWSYQVGLKGEAVNLVSPNGVSSVDWVRTSLASQNRPQLKWHKAYFNAPNGIEPLALDMSSMGKGQVWINGQSIGRYWMVYAKGKCNGCNYAGTYRQAKCQIGCGQPTQRWYHVPRSWLKPTNNLLVVFEELGGNPWKISLVKRIVHTPRVSESNLMTNTTQE